MARHDAVDNAGTPQADRLYAVFESEREAQRAETAVRGLGVPASPIKDPQVLQGPTKGAAGVLGTITRLMKGFGGERQEAERYATHLEHGQVVLAIQVRYREDAEQIARVLAQHGGFDMTYFSGAMIEEMCPEVDALHGVPSRDVGTSTDSRSTGHAPVEHG